MNTGNRGDLDKRYMEYIQSDKWRKLSAERMRIDEHTCQCCGTHGTTQNPLQVHHMKYDTLGNEDVYTQLVTLCKACHRGIHRVMARKTSPSGRRGWRDCTYVPSVSVCEMGTSIEVFEDEGSKAE